MLADAGTIVLADDFSHPSNQGWQRQVTTTLHQEFKVRVTVYRDSYDFQSRIYSEVFSPVTLKWERLQSLAGNDFSALPSAYSKNQSECEHAAEPILNSLLDYAAGVLG
jgi:hypothetical protein